MALIHQATAEANNLAAVATAKDQYNKHMEKVSLFNHNNLTCVSVPYMLILYQLFEANV